MKTRGTDLLNEYYIILFFPYTSPMNAFSVGIHETVDFHMCTNFDFPTQLYSDWLNLMANCNIPFCSKFSPLFETRREFYMILLTWKACCKQARL